MLARPRSSARRKQLLLRRLVVAAGVIWSALFVIVALAFELQLYADGAMFSYAVAAEDVWAFHWHNIASRASVFFLSLWPAETMVGLTGSPAAGIFTYGFLFYVAPLAGLIGTFVIDRSRDRLMFVYACASTALLCPLVFGFPTEMWIAHVLFWPTFAASHDGRQIPLTTVLLLLLVIALVFTHAGGIVLAFVVVATLALHGWRNFLFLRGAAILAVAMAIWVAVKVIYPPDDYFADVLVRAALHFFDPAIVEVNLVLLLIAVLTGYGLVFFVLSRSLKDENALLIALTLTFIALLFYWVRFDYWVHASNRYYLRTLLVVLTPVFAAFAALYALRADGLLPPRLRRAVKALNGRKPILGLTGAFVLVMAVHIGQTAYFVTDWTLYKAAVRRLATGSASDPALGDPRFVSSQRIAPELNQLGWFSTIEYLSVIVSDFKPARLVVDPAGNYFWLSCKTATDNAKARGPVPAPARDLVRIYSCLHR
jgi:hypothetical protein